YGIEFLQDYFNNIQSFPPSGYPVQKACTHQNHFKPFNVASTHSPMFLCIHISHGLIIRYQGPQMFGIFSTGGTIFNSTQTRMPNSNINVIAPDQVCYSPL